MNLFNYKRIVVIEDDPEYMEMLKLKLHINGFEVIATQDALDGLKLVRLKMPDLVILDLRMPGSWMPGAESENILDRHMGLKICRMIKFDTKIRHIPILVLTGSDSVEDIQHAVQCGADGYLMKTASAEYLIREIMKMTGGQAVMASPEVCSDLS